MDSARWDRIQALFHEAVDLPDGEREAFLQAACGRDDALRDDVAAAIDEDRRGSSLLDAGLEHAAGRILDGATPAALQQIGPYRLVRTIGEGGMGVVFLAERIDLGTTAAVKILRDAWLSPARRRRFAEEQRTLARLSHPSIARLFDAGALDDGTPWIVMEFVEGAPITDACRGLDADTRLRVFGQVCEAVQHAHQQLVVHRDLKPSNILVTAGGQVKLLDFGIARTIGLPRAGGDATRTVARLMTPAYAAPEQARGEAPGVQADVYSLGVILYELLTGTLPQRQISADQTPGAAAAVRPSAQPGHVAAPAWADLDVLCLTAIHPDPQRRYASVEALARDVAHYRAGEPLEARADSFRYRAGKFVRRSWRGLATAAAVLAAVVALVAFYTVRLRDARNAAVAEAARTQRIQSMMLDLFDGGDAAAGPAQDLRAVTLVDRGAREAEGLVGEPAVQADMFAALGGIYQKLGNLPRSETLLAAALDARRRVAGSASADVASSLVALARLRLAQARFVEAEQLVRDALDIRTRAAGPEAPIVADTLTALGEVLVEKGEYPSAIEVLERAVASRAAAGEGPELAAALRQEVNANFYAGRFDRAEAIGRRVLAMSRRVHGARHPLVADDLVNLGAVAHERGRYDEAERAYRDALALTEAWYGPDHTRTASNLTMLGRTLSFEKRYDEAVASLTRALAIQERVFGKVHPAVASAVNDLGSVALQRQRYDDAAAAFSRMVDIYRAVYPGQHYLIGIALSNLGSVNAAKQDYRRAETLFREAITVFTATQSSTHLNVGIGRLKLGRALLRQGRYADAEPELLAGYGIVSGQSSPSVSWLQAGRDDLAALYKATGRPERAAGLDGAPSAASSGASTTPRAR